MAINETDNTGHLKGNVLRIERASIHDGQGLRTVIFLKGCPLNCPWCSTPESRNSGIERGYIRSLCSACRRCINICPADALSICSTGDKVTYKNHECALCFNCADACLNGAVKKYGCQMTVNQVMEEIAKDEIFYYHSGGGITISGGEPLAQPLFTAEVLKSSKEAGIHTAMESCFFAEMKVIETMLPLLDLLYVDIKHMNSSVHRSWTGEGNEVILNNLHNTASYPYPFSLVIRIPLIKSFNDDMQNLEETLQFVEKLPRVKLIELLPYHRMGSETYDHLGQVYSCSTLATHTTEELEKLSAMMNSKSKNIFVSVGSGFSAK